MDPYPSSEGFLNAFYPTVSHDCARQRECAMGPPRQHSSVTTTLRTVVDREFDWHRSNAKTPACAKGLILNTAEGFRPPPDLRSPQAPRPRRRGARRLVPASARSLDRRRDRSVNMFGSPAPTTPAPGGGLFGAPAGACPLPPPPLFFPRICGSSRLLPSRSPLTALTRAFLLALQLPAADSEPPPPLRDSNPRPRAEACSARPPPPRPREAGAPPPPPPREADSWRVRARVHAGVRRARARARDRRRPLRRRRPGVHASGGRRSVGAAAPHPRQPSAVDYSARPRR